MNQYIKLAAITLISITILGACTMGAQAPNMSYIQQGINHPNFLKNQIHLTTVTGGQKTVLEGEPRVSNENLMQAIQTSLDHYKLSNTSGDYELNATLVDLSIPLAFTSMAIQTEPTIRYVVKNKETGKTLMDRTFTTFYATSPENGGAYGKGYIIRLRRTLELSVQKNIEKFLQELSTVKKEA